MSWAAGPCCWPFHLHLLSSCKDAPHILRQHLPWVWGALFEGGKSPGDAHLDLPRADVKLLQDVDEEVLNLHPGVDAVGAIQDNDDVHVGLAPWEVGDTVTATQGASVCKFLILQMMAQRTVEKGPCYMCVIPRVSFPGLESCPWQDICLGNGDGKPRSSWLCSGTQCWPFEQSLTAPSCLCSPGTGHRQRVSVSDSADTARSSTWLFVCCTGQAGIYNFQPE